MTPKTKKTPVTRKKGRPRKKKVTATAQQSAIGAKQRKAKSLANLKPPWKPGQSGNPNGTPKARTHLYRYLCGYLGMTKAQLMEVAAHEEHLTLSQIAALKMAQRVSNGDWKPILEIINRDEGKVVERVAVQDDSAMTPAQAMEILAELKRKG